MVLCSVIWVNSCALLPRDDVFKKVEAWRPDQSDGEGFDYVSEMIKDLDLDRRKETLVIGDIRKEWLPECYRRVVRSEDGFFQSEGKGGPVRFRMHPKLAMQLESSSGWGNSASFAAVCVCLKRNRGDLPECIAIQFEGGPFYKISDTTGRHGAD